MISRLSVINFNNKLYKLYIEDRILYVSEGGYVKEISRNVLEYDISCNEKRIVIAFFDAAYSIYIEEFRYSIKEDIKKRPVLKVGKNIKRIDGLTLYIDDNDVVTLIFRGADIKNGRSYILRSTGFSKELRVISEADGTKYNVPITACRYKNEELIIISKDLGRGEYILYNLTSCKVISVLILLNVVNISMKEYNNRLVLIYSKITDKDILLKYRYLEFDDSRIILGEERKLYQKGNINRPQISVYNNKLYLAWISNKVRYTSMSSDLKIWSESQYRSNGSLVSAGVYKIEKDVVHTFRTYLDERCIYGSNQVVVKNNLKIGKDYEITPKHNEMGLVSNAEAVMEGNKKDKNIREDMMKLLLYDKKISNTYKRMYMQIALDDELAERYYKSLKRIAELQAIIDEKDKYILKLLDIK